jgi:hypothetical protein
VRANATYRCCPNGLYQVRCGFSESEIYSSDEKCPALLLESEAPPQVFGQLSSHTTFFIRIGRQAPTQGLIEQMAM